MCYFCHNSAAEVIPQSPERMMWTHTHTHTPTSTTPLSMFITWHSFIRETPDAHYRTTDQYLIWRNKLRLFVFHVRWKCLSIVTIAGAHSSNNKIIICREKVRREIKKHNLVYVFSVEMIDIVAPLCYSSYVSSLHLSFHSL